MNTLITMIFAAALTTGISAAEPSLRFADSFKDGNLKGNTIWKSPKKSWSVENNCLRPSGKIAFESVSTSDFKPLEDGTFKLSFKVKFTSGEKSGNNRFTIKLRDSRSQYACYSATIAQGTSNNCKLAIEQNHKIKEIATMSPKKAFFFEPGKMVNVEFSRNTDGHLILRVDGVIRMEATDSTLKRFDTLQFTDRCYNEKMIQLFSDIKLFNN